MSSCSLRVDDRQDPVAAVVTGELDRTNAEKFVDEVNAVPGTRPLILDLSELRFIDSAGFSAVIRMLEQHLVVIVLAPVSFLRKAATVMGLPFHDHPDAARAALRGSG